MGIRKSFLIEMKKEETEFIEDIKLVGINFAIFEWILHYAKKIEMKELKELLEQELEQV